jgi:hypothetical protein
MRTLRVKRFVTKIDVVKNKEMVIIYSYNEKVDARTFSYYTEKISLSSFREENAPFECNIFLNMRSIILSFPRFREQHDKSETDDTTVLISAEVPLFVPI